MKNKIILTAEAELIDKDCREWLSKVERKLEMINDRTKRHTQQIKELEKKA